MLVLPLPFTSTLHFELHTSFGEGCTRHKSRFATLELHLIHNHRIEIFSAMHN